jgi:transposase
MKNRAENILRLKYQKILPTLNERSRRYWAATEAYAYGWGGIAIVCKATGFSKVTIHKGLKEIQNRNSLDFNRLRKNGGGRKKIIDQQPNILNAIESIVDPTSRGDPESTLRWSSKSVRKICMQLNAQNYKISFKSVSSLLKKLGYSLQSNKKTKEG